MHRLVRLARCPGPTSAPMLIFRRPHLPKPSTKLLFHPRGAARDYVLQPVIMTCPERRDLLENTLRSWGKTDAAHCSPLVCLDSNLRLATQTRMTRNGLTALKLALYQEPDFVLFLEDDIEFNVHLLHNLQCWSALAINPPSNFFGSLYDPNLPFLSRQGDCSTVHQQAAWGSQALIFRHFVAEYFIKHWEKAAGLVDSRMYALANRCGKLLFHYPSLVQHVGEKSTWGGFPHVSGSFKADHKADETAFTVTGSSSRS